MSCTVTVSAYLYNTTVITKNIVYNQIHVFHKHSIYSKPTYQDSGKIQALDVPATLNGGMMFNRGTSAASG